MTNKRLSVVVITRNEQAVLADCLQSVQWADEIVVLDGASSDKTVELAQSMGAKVYHSENWQGFGIQRQRAQRHASGEYILMLDADERVTPTLQQSITTLLASNSLDDGNVYAVARKNYFLNRPCDRYFGGADWVVRLYARSHYHYTTQQVHESLEYNAAPVIRLAGELHHFSCRSIPQFQEKQLRYAHDWARERYARGQKAQLVQAVMHALMAFIRTWLLHGSCLAGGNGLLLAVINAQYSFNKYSILWALHRTSAHPHAD